MEPIVSRTLRTLAALFALAPLPGLAAAGARAETEAIAVERLSPTSLTLEPRIDYEKATLRIVGPKGYEVRKRFAGGVALTADLLADCAPAVSGQQGERKRAIAAPAAAESVLDDVAITTRQSSWMPLDSPGG
jgi:hypothetical protein